MQLSGATAHGAAAAGRRKLRAVCLRCASLHARALFAIVGSAIEATSHARARSNDTHDGRRRVLTDFSTKFEWVCPVSRQQLFGTSLKVIRSVDEDLRAEAVTGEESKLERNWCREPPANKAPEWVIATIHEHLETYYYPEPDATAADGRGIYRPTSDDAEGKPKLWALFQKHQSKAAAETSFVAFCRYVEEKMAFEHCKLLGCST